VQRSRWLILLGSCALVCVLLGYGVVEAQTVQRVDIAEEQHPDNVGRYAPLEEWSGDHPGKAPFEATCQACHALNDQAGAGPGLRGLEDRVPSRKRLFEYIINPDGIDEFPDDEMTAHLSALRSQWGGGMQPRGGNPSLTDEDILNIIDFILQHDWIDLDEGQLRRDIRRGRELVSGARGFRHGAPSCITCHTVGSDPDLRGSNIAGNIAHTYVLASHLGGDHESRYVEGLYAILSGPDAPSAHRYYRDERGGRPLTAGELEVVMTYFEQAMRSTGTERESNFLPILALILAALGILLIDPGLYASLFVKDEEEEDGPYEPDDHHGHDDPEPEPEPAASEVKAEKSDEKTEQKPEEKAEDKTEDKAEDSKDNPDTKPDDEDKK
jgi:cytochrome c2